MRRFATLTVALIGVIAGLMLVRTMRYGVDAPPSVASTGIAIPEGAADRLAGSLRIATISNEDPAAFDTAAFRALHRYLELSFPRVHVQLRRETVAAHSLLYAWAGSDPSLDPILLGGHLDVVPVEPGTESQWQHEPFAGRIADGFIWGRGAIDNKSTVLGTLEAVELLLSEDYRPARTIYLAFGHDEEVGGTGGAARIAARLRQDSVRLHLVLDEGGVIGVGLLQGVDSPVAMIGVAEKGFASLELSTRTEGGHSSIPPRQSAVGILSAAIARLEQHPMPARLEGATHQLFEHIGPALPFAQRAVFANLWLTRPLVTRTLEANPTTNAMIRTTAAATLFQAGTKDNVLPSHARAVINFRILPGDSVAGVLQHVRRTMEDERIEVRVVGRFSAEPSALSRAESPGFRVLAQTVRSLSPETVVAPWLVVVVTDARYYAGLSDEVFRFLPLRLGPTDIARMHGTNERVAVRDYEWAIRYYRQLIRSATQS